METYIVRIYRRDEKDPQSIAGIVEVSGTDEKRPFNRLDALVMILSPRYGTIRSSPWRIEETRKEGPGFGHSKTAIIRQPEEDGS